MPPFLHDGNGAAVRDKEVLMPACPGPAGLAGVFFLPAGLWALKGLRLSNGRRARQCSGIEAFKGIDNHSSNGCPA
jgi:hypothetical protein